MELDGRAAVPVVNVERLNGLDTSQDHTTFTAQARIAIHVQGPIIAANTKMQACGMNTV